ncbi:transcriptional activator of comK gene [Oceanobacillus iheyensis HTE831]|uniref:Transcriptional activator of comK protein n=1 Tax=Oceanobacillus iheyensis (strain DSM 14371 / CIP 107618 / JCM 11309 / KCTC 3954 / HTE831) TaxID=221109 RepID=Q8ERU7_OCEIH|nr:transcriptional activator of comK gene [Oceanobacillus iheyensis HTE831]
MKKLFIAILFISVCTLSACSYFESGNIQNVGFLVETDIDENPWTQTGYEGMQQIEDKYQVDVMYKENIQSMQDVRVAVDELAQDGVNLIFGHSNMYGEYFMELSDSYPDVHFVYMNGGEVKSNVTSLNFDGHAMGFFAGMVAGQMTMNNDVGIIAAHSWQPEIEGFYEGVKYISPTTEIELDYLNDWNNTELALKVYEEMKEEGVDVFYPIGNSFSEPIIKKAQEDNLYAIGYLTNQTELAPDTVLTSTLQHIDQLYLHITDLFDKSELQGEIYNFDFQDEFVGLGEFNETISDEFQEKIKSDIQRFKETGNLPNEDNKN